MFLEIRGKKRRHVDFNLENKQEFIRYLFSKEINPTKAVNEKLDEMIQQTGWEPERKWGHEK